MNKNLGEEMTVRVVLPAYNEAVSLGKLLPVLWETLRRSRWGFKIYVVDDGSSDETAKVVRVLKREFRNIKLISHQKNRGLAEAINTGFRKALGESKAEDIIITMDADNTHLPGLIVRMVRLIREGHDVIVCSRFTLGSRVKGVPIFRQLLSYCGGLMFRLLFPLKGVKDYTSGFRAYRVGILRRGIREYGSNFIERKGFSCMVDILLKLRKFDPIVAEVPMILRYDLKEGKSKMRVGKTILETLELILRRLLEDLPNRLLGVNFWALLMVVFWFSRTLLLNRLPLFSDEAYAIVRGWELRETGELLGMIKYTTQPFFIWLVALFQLLPLNVVVAGRLVSAMSGFVTALVLSKLAGKWISPRARNLAFALALMIPFGVFFDRTILFESTTLMNMSLAMIWPAVFVPLAILTKQIGWLILPLSIAVLVSEKKKWLKVLLMGIAVPLLVWWLALGDFSRVIEINFGQAAAPLSGAVNIRNNLLRAKLWLIGYFSLPLLLMTAWGGVVTVVESVKKRWLTPLLVILGWTVGVLLFESKVASIFYPRYLYPMMLGVILLSTKGSWGAGKLIEEKVISIWWRRAGQMVLGVAVFYPLVVGSSQIIFRPEEAPIPGETRFQFYEDWTSGVGNEEIIRAILQSNKSPKKETKIFLEENNSYFVLLKSDKRLSGATVLVADWLVDPLGDIPKKVLTGGETIYFIRNRHPDIPADWPVELIAEVKKTELRSVYLYRLSLKRKQ